jgi:hypothetical protein
MSKKPKASGSKKAAGKKTKSPPPGKSQRERFIAAAREIGVDESGKEFDAALKKIIHPRG